MFADVEILYDAGRQVQTVPVNAILEGFAPGDRNRPGQRRRQTGGSQTPVDTDTQFQAGSISKPLTAVGILLLSASGKLDLDADVNTYLKGWRLESQFTNNPVTLRQLLCHRAGMAPHGFLGYTERAKVPSLLEVLNRRDAVLGWLTAHQLGTIKIINPPGSSFRYSAGGYCVVQKAVEDITGARFEGAMAELVLQPVGMSRSNFEQPPLETNNIACGYGWMKTILGGGRWRVCPEKAAAGLWTTPTDLARFILAIQEAGSGKMTARISPAIAEEFLKPQFDPSQGAGIFLDGKGKGRGFYHAGENLGYFARFGAGVSNGRGWVIMSNAQKDKFTPILNAIVKEFGWKGED